MVQIVSLLLTSCKNGQLGVNTGECSQLPRTVGVLSPLIVLPLGLVHNCLVTWGNPGKINCDNQDVTLGSYPPVVHGTKGRK